MLRLGGLLRSPRENGDNKPAEKKGENKPVGDGSPMNPMGGDA